MPTKRHKPLMLLAISLCSGLFASFATAYPAPVCPADCSCFADGQKSHQKITCHWQNIAGTGSFSAFDNEHTLSLVIHCNASFTQNSHYAAGMFLTLKRLRNLRMTNCISNDNRLPTGMFDGLTELRSLKLENLIREPEQPLKIEKKAFQALQSLEHLQISGYSLDKLPMSEISLLVELKVLNVSNNKITELSSNHHYTDQQYPADQRSNSLVILDLSRNQLKRLSIAADFRNLHILYLNQNLLQDLPDQFFEIMPKLQELYLQHNNLHQLDTSALRSLKILDLSHNRISVIPIFQIGQTSLQKWNLSNNHIDQFGVLGMVWPSTLEELDLSHNRIKAITVDLFSNATALKHLRLSNNFIVNIESGALQNLAQLNTVDLSSNAIAYLLRDSFKGLAALLTLNLHNNSISSIAEDFFSPMSQLVIVSLAQNQIVEVPTALTVLYYLTDLNLSQNRITRLQKFLFDKLQNLQRLSLADNAIVAVDRYVFENMPKLEQLNLASNSIKQLASDCFNGNMHLKIVNLRNNVLNEVNGALSNLKSLREADLSYNKFVHVDLSVFPSSLTALHLSNNRIRKFTDFLKKPFPGLELLNLGHNQLTLLSASMLPNAVQLANFSHNQFTEIVDSTLLQKTNLVSLDLRHNRLTSLNQSSVLLEEPVNGAPPRNLPLLYLAGNALTCSCNVDWLKSPESHVTAAIQNHPIIADYRQLVCHSEAGIALEPLHSVSKDRFLCGYDTLCSEPDCPCCEFPSCDCKSVCPPGCRCFHDSAFNVNIVNCSSAIYAPISPSSIPMLATQISLDGNFIPELRRNDFLGRYRLRKLYLNNTGLRSIGQRAFYGLTSLETLDLSGNELSELRGDEFFNTPKLTSLRLHDNRISTVSPTAFANLDALKALTLGGNQLKEVPTVLMDPTCPLTDLTLADNPWRCDCDDRFEIQTWLPQHTRLVRDSQQIYCFENLTAADANSTTILSILPPSPENTVKVNFWAFSAEINATFCYPVIVSITAPLPNNDGGVRQIGDLEATTDDLTNVLVAVVASLAGLLAVLMLIVFLVWLQRRRWRHKHGGSSYEEEHTVLSATSRADTLPPPTQQYYDAFLIYSSCDKQFVEGILAPLMESTLPAPRARLCLLHRDLSVCTTYHQILDKDMLSRMECSERIVMLVTPDFIAQEWRLSQITSAVQQAKHERRPLILLVKDVIDMNDMDSTLGNYMRTNNYVIWNEKDPMLIEHLRSSMQSCRNTITRTLSLSHDAYSPVIVPSNFV